ncbi:hypothetical protein ABPG75_011985 [Micractinium tetrahymenae]
MTDAAVPPPGAAQPVAALAPPASDPPSRADSVTSALSQGSGTCSEHAGGVGGSAPNSVGLATPHNGSLELDAASSSSGASLEGGAAGGSALQRGGSAAAPGSNPKKDTDAKSSALKALAGVSAIVSKSRKVDAEALQAIKSQRAKARAEGHPAGSSLSAASSLPAPGASGAAGRATPPPAAPLAGTVDSGTGLSPFASATSQGLTRTPSSSNLTAGLGGSGAPGGTALGQATSLPISMHSTQRNRRPSTTPPASAADFDALVSKMTITELVALKQAVEGQLAKQALALAQLQASTQQAAQADVLSQQYAALLLQSAQQAQLVQQLSSQQQAAHAAAIQQALSAAAAAAGISSPSISPEQLLLGGGGVHSAGGAGSAGISAYPSMPLPDMASPFASAPYPPESGFGMGEAPRPPVSLPQRTFTAGTGGAASKSSGSLRSASAEQHLIGEALHSFVDPERQGPPSRQGSALVNGINWCDRRGLTGAGAAASGAFARSRSLPQPEDVLYQDCSASLNPYLGDGTDQQLPSLFNSLRIAESLSQQQQAAGADGGMPPSAFAPARSGSLQVPLPRSSPQRQGMGAMSPPHVVFADSVQTRTYQPGY